MLRTYKYARSTAYMMDRYYFALRMHVNLGAALHSVFNEAVGRYHAYFCPSMQSMHRCLGSVHAQFIEGGSVIGPGTKGYNSMLWVGKLLKVCVAPTLAMRFPSGSCADVHEVNLHQYRYVDLGCVLFWLSKDKYCRSFLFLSNLWTICYDEA